MKKYKTAIQAIWITPLRALAVEIQKAIQIMTNDLNPDLKIALRTGDTSQKERGKKVKCMQNIEYNLDIKEEMIIL